MEDQNRILTMVVRGKSHLLENSDFHDRDRRECISSVQFTQLCPTLCNPWIAACQISLSIANSWSLPKLTSIESVMPSNHLILCHPLLLPRSNFPSIRVFSNQLVLPIRWPKYRSFSFSINPSNEYSGLISLIFSAQLSDLYTGFSSGRSGGLVFPSLSEFSSLL